MGWFLRCLCFKPHNHRRISSENRRDHLVSRSRIASLPLLEEKEGSPYKDNVNRGLESRIQASKEKELVDKKDYLVSRNQIASLPLPEEKEGSPYKDNVNRGLESCIQASKEEELVDKDPWVSQNQLESLLLAEEKEGSPCKDNVHLGLEFPSQANSKKELADEVPVSPVKPCEELEKEAGSPEHKPSSCVSMEQKLEERNSTGFSESSRIEIPDESSKTPVHLTDRPIFGTVGLYWNNDNL